LEDKRTILQELGSNLFLNDKKLEIQLAKPFQIIEKGLKVVGIGNARLEPSISGSFEAKEDLSASNFLSWCTTVDDVRTYFEKTTKSEA